MTANKKDITEVKGFLIAPNGFQEETAQPAATPAPEEKLYAGMGIWVVIKGISKEK